MRLTIGVFEHEGLVLGQFLTEERVPRGVAIDFVPLKVRGLINFPQNLTLAQAVEFAKGTDWRRTIDAILAVPVVELNVVEGLRGHANSVVDALGAPDADGKYRVFSMKLNGHEGRFAVDLSLLKGKAA